MNRNFPCAYDMELEDVREWAQSRETALPVAVAIWAIADGQCAAQRIWEKPTPSEWDQIYPDSSISRKEWVARRRVMDSSLRHDSRGLPFA